MSGDLPDHQAARDGGEKLDPPVRKDPQVPWEKGDLPVVEDCPA